MTQASIAHAPSDFSWVVSTGIRRIPLICRYFEKRQVERTYELAKKAAEHEFPIRVVTSGWATKDCLSNSSYIALTKEFVKIDRATKANFLGRIVQSLHWSRRYEYPFAIINSGLSQHPSAGLSILDCGSGLSPVQFWLAMKGYKVHSLDIDLRELKRVAKFRSNNNLNDLYPTYGNVLDLPFPDCYFDIVFCISVLEHVIYPLVQNPHVVLKGFLNEVLRVLRPRGRIVLSFDVNLDQQKSCHRLFYHEYESLCRILGIQPRPPPQNRLCSSDTKEGRMMGEALCVYYVVLAHDLSAPAGASN